VPASPARICAHRVLRRVTSEGAYADRAFRAEAERAGLDPRERALAQRLAYGVVQRLRTVDWLLDRLASRPLDDIQPEVLDALRLGVLQLLWLDSVPDRAAVDQTVELVKAEAPRATGFANAVMRRGAREAARLLRTLPRDSAVLHSHPEWLAEMWAEALGPDQARELMERDNEPAESAVRANELRASADEVRMALAERDVATREAPGLPEGMVIDGPFDAHGSDLFERGWLMPQSRASMLVGRVLAPRPGERVLDLCAAPGAKSTHLAALMGGDGEVVSVEENPARAEELRATCARLGAGIVAVREADAREPVDPAGFDRVLLDPPCSDLGTLQSRPDARWRKGPDQIRELAVLQRELLEAAVASVRSGGVLVYSTCTISPAENREQVAALLADHAELSADDLSAQRPELALPEDPRFLQLLPHRDRTDGFFIARLLRDP
jgi:16S rRNA (cytosine967-C5)-methyltransferase